MIEILKLPMQENDAEAKTIGGYLITLSREVWLQNESFSGKRPFGNSGWEYEMYEALARHDLIPAKKITYEDDPDYIEYDYSDSAMNKAEKIIHECYLELFKIVGEIE